MDGQHGDVENNLETNVHPIHGNQQNVTRKMEEKLERFSNIWQKTGFSGYLSFHGIRGQATAKKQCPLCRGG